MNAKQRNAVERLRKAIDNLEAAFEAPVARKGSVKITQGKKVDKKTLAPHYSARKRKSPRKTNGM